MERTIKLTEGQLNRIVLNTAKRIIKEGTANFSVNNANGYYVISDETLEYGYDDLQYALEDEGWDACSEDEYKDGLRLLAYKSVGSFEIALGLRAGYYEGATLDYEIIYNEAYGLYLSNFNSAEDFINEIVDLTNGSESAEELANDFDTAIDIAEETCKNLAESELSLAGRFSNGEAVYNQIR